MHFSSAVDIAQTLFLFVTTVVAVKGIDTWRDQTIGGKRIELAEDVLARFYRARDVIRQMRNPFVSQAEAITRTREEHESEEEAWALDNANVPFARFNRDREVFDELRALRYRFMAHHGKGAAKPFDDLYEIVSRIFAAANSLAHTHWRRRATLDLEPDARRRMDEAREKAEAVFWWSGSDDAIDKELDAIIERIEAICQPYIESTTKRLSRRRFWPW
jgi:hypothetical protein